MGVNRVILLGNLGENPKIQYLESGAMKASFSLATNETHRNKEGIKIVHTEWHSIVLWSRLAEVAEKYLMKGKQIYLEGRIVNRSYVSKKDGQTRHVTEIVGRSLVLLGDPRSGYDTEKEEDQEKDMSPIEPPIEQDAEEDFLPF